MSRSITPPLDILRTIAPNILEYISTGRDVWGKDTWISKRDQTQLLIELESVEFKETRNIFFIPLHVLATLDDELYVTRALENQVEPIIHG